MFELLMVQPQDALKLSKFAEKCYRDTFAADNLPEHMEAYLAGAFSEEKQRRELLDAKRRTVVATIDQEWAGYFHLLDGEAEKCVTDPKPIELVRLYVDFRWHSQGVAHQLMKEALSESVRMGFETMWLGVWEKNLRAQKFYKKWSFKQVGSHDFYMGTDCQHDFIYTKSLLDR